MGWQGRLEISNLKSSIPPSQFLARSTLPRRLMSGFEREPNAKNRPMWDVAMRYEVKDAQQFCFSVIKLVIADRVGLGSIDNSLCEDFYQ